MKTISLNGTWRMTGGAYDLECTVPGSVVSALLAHGAIPDPYYGTNEAEIQPLFENDYTFFRTFTLTEEDLHHDRILLRCDGLDTLCQLSVNETVIAETENMHCRYEFDLRNVVHTGENTISLLFRSPVVYMKNATSPLGKSFASMRKAHCMFGWDWGIRLPDSGIWKDICIELTDAARLKDLKVRQQHEGQRVVLQITAHSEFYTPGAQLHLAIQAPDGSVLFDKTLSAKKKNCETVTVEKPELWWPAGYGEQPLYQVVAILQKDGEELDSRTLQIGLRTVSLYRGADGKSDYQILVNGTPVYIKGANIVIDDAVISRSTAQRWERMVRNARLANYNALRVWGGAYYPPDVFFELCDRSGILVYQDFMFACRFYWPDKKFLKSVSKEIAQVTARLRSHPSLCLWCGNNEADFFYTAFISDEPETAAIREAFGKKKLSGVERILVKWLYSKTFLKLIPKIVRGQAPDIPYVHSSPSVGERLGAQSLFDYFSNGDAHYYHHVNGDAPYQKLGNYHLRFLSEFGFQSYPSLKTLKECLPDKELSPYSDGMLSHQKSGDGNKTIELYMSRDFFVPQDFSQYVYMTQVTAAEILRYTAEHMRRDREYSRGLLLWQHNDCWPVISWAGVDYCGRWKAQQYYAKRFFAPVLATAIAENYRAALYLTNDMTSPVTGELEWTLYSACRILAQGRTEVTIPALSAGRYGELDVCAGPDVVLTFSFQSGGEILSRGSLLFVPEKEFTFELPTIKLFADICECGYRICLIADRFVKSLRLDLEDGDGIFSDNFFDLEPNRPYTVTIEKGDLVGVSTLEELKRKLVLQCVNEIACGGRLTVDWEK